MNVRVWKGSQETDDVAVEIELAGLTYRLHVTAEQLASTSVLYPHRHEFVVTKTPLEELAECDMAGHRKAAERAEIRVFKVGDQVIILDQGFEKGLLGKIGKVVGFETNLIRVDVVGDGCWSFRRDQIGPWPTHPQHDLMGTDCDIAIDESMDKIAAADQMLGLSPQPKDDPLVHIEPGQDPETGMINGRYL